MIDFIDIKTFYTILHLFGVAIGAGGAFTSDAMFFLSVKDKKFSETEVRFLKLGSAMVWTGLALLYLSGFALFTLDPDKYMNSSKFVSKMFIIGAITINGVMIHVNHLPLIIKNAGKKFSSSKEFIEKRSLLLVGGAISVVSWSFSIILGALRSVPYPTTTILAFYVTVVAVAAVISLSLKKYIFGK